jgi:predicted Zn finger-like uncharacterized protein
MEVRCERCKTEYDFEDTGVPEAGVAVQCTTCGHVFKVKKKAVLVTMPLEPGDMTPVGTPAPEPVRAPAPPVQREWKVRQANGNHFTFRELTTLQKWIVEGKVGRDDEISLAGTEHWKRLGNITALVPFFSIVEKAENGPQAEVRGVINDRQPPGPTVPEGTLSTPAVYPPITSPSAQTAPRSTDSGPLPRIATGPSIHRFPSAPTVIVEEFGDQDAEDPKTGRAAWLLLLLTIVLLGGGGYFGYMYYWQPQRQKEQAVARESARAAQVQAEKDRAAALARSKAIEEARAKIAQETKSQDEGPSSQAASPPDAAASAPSNSEAGAAVAKKETLSGTAQRASRAEPPRNFDYYMIQGYRYLEKQSPMLAVEAFGKAADLRPDRAEPFGGRGLALLQIGDLPQAEASFQEALKLNPNFGIAVIGLAKTYLSQGKKDKAADYYGKYLEILPDGPEANGAKLALKRLRQE